MSVSDQKHTGQQILSKTDQLIETIIAFGMNNEVGRRELLEQGVLVMSEIFSLLRRIIGDREEYITAAVKELISQRVADHRFLEKLDYFDELLEEICLRAWNAVPPVSVPKDELQEKDSITQKACCYHSEVEKAFALVFPDLRPVKNYFYKGIQFEYFFPSLRIAVEDESRDKSGRGLVRKEFICRKDGIRLIRLNFEKMLGYRDIARNIRRQLLLSGTR